MRIKRFLYRVAVLMKLNLPPFSLRDKIGYAMGDFGCYLTFSLVTNYLIVFYTQYVGIPMAQFGVIVFFLKTWDAVSDLVLGALIDRIRLSDKSKYKPWIKIGSIGFCITGALVFLPFKDINMTLRYIMLIVMYFVWDTCYTMVNVPYGAMHSTITAKQNERIALSTWRNIGGIAAGALIMLVPFLVYDENDMLLGNRFIYLAVVISIVGFTAFTLLRTLPEERVEPPKNLIKIGYLQVLRDCLKNRPFMAMCIATLASLMFFMSSQTTTAYVFQCYFRASNILPLANIASYVPMAFGVLFIGKIAKKIGKKLAVGIPVLVSIVTCIVMLIVPIGTNGAVFYIVCMMFVNTGAGAFTLLTWAIISDCIDYQQYTTGSRDEASIFAVYSMIRKFAYALASTLIAFVLSSIGYDETLGANQTAQTALNIKNSAIILLLIGGVIMAASIFFIYNLGKEKTLAVAAELGLDKGEVDINEAIVNMND